MEFDLLQKLEQHLTSVMVPVQPDTDYIQKIRHGLANVPAISIEQRSRMTLILLITTGLFLGAMFLWLLRRLR
jgi:hypothetical protein